MPKLDRRSVMAGAAAVTGAMSSGLRAATPAPVAAPLRREMVLADGW